MAEVKLAPAVRLTADMWTSINMDAYLSVTCHYVKDDFNLATAHFPLTHSAAHSGEATGNLMAMLDISDKVSGMVTDGAHNIVASVNQLNLKT